MKSTSAHSSFTTTKIFPKTTTSDLNCTQWPILMRSDEHTCFSGAQQHDKSKHAWAVIRHGELAPQGGSGNLLFVPAVTAHFYCSEWITEGMELTGWFTDLCLSTMLLFSANPGVHNLAHGGSASCSTSICPRKSCKDIHHPHTLTCAYWCRASSV